MMEKSVTKYTALTLVSVFLVASANHSFFAATLAIYPWAENQGFILSMGVLVLAVQLFVASLLALVFPLRYVLIALLLIAAPAAYFADTYGTVINDEMLRNVIETNAGESADLFSLSFLLRVVLLGVVPAFLLIRLSWARSPWWKEKLQMSGMAALSLLIAAGCIASASDQYASFFREHKPVRYYINPGYPLYSAIQLAADQWGGAEAGELRLLGANPHIVGSGEKSELVIVVVGETLRADHLGLNGYERDTTPLLAQRQRLISYQRISACGTSTAVSVPCMFSYQGHKNIDVGQARNSENVLDLLSQAGVNVLWRDNNSDSKGVAARVPFQDFRSPQVNPVCDEECRDVGMLSDLQDYIDGTAGDKLIVLHQMGNHGPAYFKRYPKEFEIYTPACKTNELSDCSAQEVINAYDNAVRYTDYFLDQTIALLERNTPDYETTLFFVSDHGESLGERGLYLHGLPYAFAPEAQTHLPLLVWAGESSDVDYEKSRDSLHLENSHDAVFDALLQLFEVRSDLQPSAARPLLSFRGES